MMVEHLERSRLRAFLRSLLVDHSIHALKALGDWLEEQDDKMAYYVRKMTHDLENSSRQSSLTEQIWGVWLPGLLHAFGFIRIECQKCHESGCDECHGSGQRWAEIGEML